MRLADPLVFEPLFMERVWGGRHLENLFGKDLPGGRIGESWEIVDRPEAQSVVHQGPLRGTTLAELWTLHHAAIFGSRGPQAGRFPLLFKLLDARERLSVQVHPPAAMAAALQGEPKTEMWYIVNCDEGADIFAGLRPGVTRDQFERALGEGTVEQMIQRVEVKAGDCIFIPSGRVHAIGAGNVIVEVQQNSDTTYRVFDWNRAGLDGKARELHIRESMDSIDFADFEPRLQPPGAEPLVECAYFKVDRWKLDQPREAVPEGEFAIFTVLEGNVRCGSLEFGPGQFFLVSASQEDRILRPLGGPVEVLRTRIP